jgi:hypothetical protein
MTAKLVTVQNDKHMENLIGYHQSTRDTEIYAFFEVRPRKYLMVVGPAEGMKEHEA